MIAEIKPVMSLSCCPFCVSHDLDLVMPVGDKAYVRCNSCGGRGPSHENSKEALEAWEAAAYRPGRLLD